MNHENAGGGTQQSLRSLEGFDVAPDDPNPIGWTVVTDDRRKVGKVTDLLVNTSTMKVAAFEIALDSEAFGAGGDERVRVQAQTVRVDETGHQVVVPSSSPELSTFLGAAGSYTGAEYSGTEVTAHAHDLSSDTGLMAGALGSTDQTGAESVRVTRAAEELRIGKRRVQAGEVLVHKTVETEQVQEPVTREVERVRVERRAVDGTGGTEARIEGDEIRIPITEEEVVVEKRAVVKEEIVISKERVQETETVSAELKRERVEIEGEGVERRPDTDSHKR